MNIRLSLILSLAVAIFIALTYSINAQGKKAMQFEDVMKFKSIKSPAISNDGNWVAFHEQPDRGDAVLRVINTSDPTTTFYDSLGTNPKFSMNSDYLIYKTNPSQIQEENAEKKDELKYGIGIIKLPEGTKVKIENTKSEFKLANNSKWIAYLVNEKPETKKDKKNRPIGTKVKLRELASNSELEFDFVTEFDFDSTASFFSFVIADPDAKKNSLNIIDLRSGFSFPKAILSGEKMHFANLKWTEKGNALSFVAGKERFDGMPDSCSLYNYSTSNGELSELISATGIPSGWRIPFKNSLAWSEDTQRLFFGFKPYTDTTEYAPEVKFSDSNYYDIEQIRKKTELDIWHKDDPRIKTFQKNIWKDIENDVFTSVYDFTQSKFIRLADEKIEFVAPVDNRYFALGYDRTPYMKEQTWDGFYSDVYLINLKDGTKKLLVERIEDNGGFADATNIQISPEGDFVVYFKDKNWHLYNTKAGVVRNLTQKLKLNFWDDEYDEPATPPNYGLGGWLEGDDAVLIYDKYDIWKFFTRDESFLNQSGTEGISKKVRFRIPNLDKYRKFYKKSEEIRIEGFNTNSMIQAVYGFNMEIMGVESLLSEEAFINVLAKARFAQKYLITKERYDQFPDLWVADSTFKNIVRLTDVNPEMRKFNWGKAQQVKWKNYEGDSLTGVLILPDDYQKDKKYPTYVYFYDRFSDYLHRFFQPSLNHRPVYPNYIGSGYIVFMPDVKYTNGNPGYNAYSCIASGVRHLAKQGFTDSTKVCLQGHSWGGYQTTYMITHTDLFAAACAGAPVGNMTSAYSGIRLGSGLARQFQYEKYQSRIGGNLWDSLDSYIRNSPVFKANKANTPLLIMFGDIDDAVPWQQGIEIYLAWRRLNKNCIFLQYRNEPHIPKKYANKMDYYIKMKEFFDHYIFGTPAPSWMTVGVEYKGR